MNHAFTLLALVLFGADKPAETVTKPVEIWQLPLREAIRIGMNNSEDDSGDQPLCGLGWITAERFHPVANVAKTRKS